MKKTETMNKNNKKEMVSVIIMTWNRDEDLKNTLNDSISKINEQLRNIASQLVHNNDTVNELKVRLEDIEKMLD